MDASGGEIPVRGVTETLPPAKVLGERYVMKVL